MSPRFPMGVLTIYSNDIYLHQVGRIRRGAAGSLRQAARQPAEEPLRVERVPVAPGDTGKDLQAVDRPGPLRPQQRIAEPLGDGRRYRFGRIDRVALHPPVRTEPVRGQSRMSRPGPLQRFAEERIRLCRPDPRPDGFHGLADDPAVELHEGDRRLDREPLQPWVRRNGEAPGPVPVEQPGQRVRIRLPRSPVHEVRRLRQTVLEDQVVRRRPLPYLEYAVEPALPEHGEHPPRLRRGQLRGREHRLPADRGQHRRGLVHRRPMVRCVRPLHRCVRAVQHAAHRYPRAPARAHPRRSCRLAMKQKDQIDRITEIQGHVPRYPGQPVELSIVQQIREVDVAELRPLKVGLLVGKALDHTRLGRWLPLLRGGEPSLICRALAPRARGRQRCSWIFRSRCAFGTAPTTVSTCRPSLKNRMLGIDRTLNRAAVWWFESTSSFATFTRPAYSLAISSTIGATIRHGPHHSAQKSTIARPSPCSISSAKFASVTAIGLTSDILFLLVPGPGPWSYPGSRVSLRSAETARTRPTP